MYEMAQKVDRKKQVYEGKMFAYSHLPVHNNLCEQ